MANVTIDATDSIVYTFDPYAVHFDLAPGVSVSIDAFRQGDGSIADAAITFYFGDSEGEQFGAWPSVDIKADAIVLKLNNSLIPVISIPIIASPILLDLEGPKGYWESVYPGSNAYRWSDIGSLNFEPGEKNVAGFSVLPWSGPAYGAVKLGSKLIAFGHGGISLLTPIAEPVVGWGEFTLSRKGIIGANAFCASSEICLFIDRDWNLCAVDSSYKIEVLGFAEFFKGTDTSLFMFHNPVQDRFYIVFKEKAFVFVPKEGLGQMMYSPTGLCIDDLGAFRSVVDQNSVDFATSALTTKRVLLNTFNFKETGMKSLRRVDINLEDVGGEWTAAQIFGVSKVIVQYRNGNGAFTEVLYPINYDGSCALCVTAQEFRIGYQIEDFSVDGTDRILEISSINFEWQNSDRRYRRSSNAG